MSANEVTVSIIMNCYNGEAFLRSALDSVIKQTFKKWEVVFWDNQSTDRSAEIVRSYSDERIRYFCAPQHAPLYEARNYAIDQAKGEFIAFLDVDDWWAPNKLERQVPLFCDPDVGLVACNFHYVDEVNERVYAGIDFQPNTDSALNDLLRSYYLGLLTLVVRKSAFESLGKGCDPRFHIIGDFDLVMRLLRNWKLAYQSESLAFYRSHGNNEIIKQANRQIDELEMWCSEIRSDRVIYSQPNFPLLMSRVGYLKGMRLLRERNWQSAFQLFLTMSNDIYKLKLGAVLFLPKFLLRRILNNPSLAGL